ncbi:MAG TPA: OadG family protein [Clostridia bacterium]|nr:OadG family protein [Clostridia bacterium]
MSFIQSLEENIMVTVLGMGVVFAVLAVLSIVILLFKYIKWGSQPNKPSKEMGQGNKEGQYFADENILVEDTNVEKGEELIAVISAAIVAYGAEDFNLRIRSIKKVGQVRSMWAMAGRNDIINSRIWR